MMLKCWCYEQDDRPSFHYMLGQLEMYKQKVEDTDSDLGRQAAMPVDQGTNQSFLTNLPSIFETLQFV